MSTQSHLRAVACRLTMAMTLWILCYHVVYGTEEGSAWIIEDLTVPLISQFDVSWENGARLVMLISPLLIVTSICTLIVTTAPHPLHLQRCTNMIFARIRSFTTKTDGGMPKRNQFALGEINFDGMACFLVALPVLWFSAFTLGQVLKGRNLTKELQLKVIGNALGMAGTLALSFFLIPVARHSVLLAAMGWSPVHALRFHIWAGYTSFIGITLHGIIHFVVWTRNQELSLWEQVWPGSDCWEWKSETKMVPRECRNQWYNFSGMLSFFFMLALVLTSLNWVRRHYYRIFYISHLVCGVGMIAGAAMHWRPIITFLAPSIIYYIASTMPALVQSLTSRARGGVRVVKVIHLSEAGGCKEIHVSTTPAANAALDNAPSMFIKMCVPTISLIWHPFTVFKHPTDPSTVRILFRPVGPFTKQLALRYENKQHTPTVLDGFYQAGNRSLEALRHDHVTFYCGGVAITPFLSLIPNLLAEIAHRKAMEEPVTIRKLVLHWACREEGLASYVTREYLIGMKRAADAMNFDFDCIVYHTKKHPNKPDPLDRHAHESAAESHPMDTTFLSEISFDDGKGMEVAADSKKRQRKDHDDNDGVPKRVIPPKFDQVVQMIGEATENATTHSMELSRLMPARHGTVWRNIPAFVAVGGSLWLLFYIIFSYYNDYDIKVHEFYDRLGPLILCLLAAILLSLGFEFCALVSPVLWQDDQPPVSRSTATSAYLSADEETIHDTAAVIEHRDGRPIVSEIFIEPQRATCPGIFMCGPPSMTKQIRDKANGENSVFGLTRYALYEDPFEM